MLSTVATSCACPQALCAAVSDARQMLVVIDHDSSTQPTNKVSLYFCRFVVACPTAIELGIIERVPHFAMLAHMDAFYVAFTIIVDI